MLCVYRMNCWERESLLIQKDNSISKRGWKSHRQRPETTEAASSCDDRVFYVGILRRIALNVPGSL